MMQVEPIRLQASDNDWSKSAVLGPRSSEARNFADLVAARLLGTVLPFSERESLVRTAARHDISRFEANLIIAAVQHQMGMGRRRIAPQAWLGFRLSPALAEFAAIHTKIIATVQDHWQIGRRWAIEKRVWPGPKCSAAFAAMKTATARIIAAAQRKMGMGRRRPATPRPEGLRYSTALATFAAIQGGIIAVVWYWFF
jgi:hypothetical protein